MCGEGGVVGVPWTPGRHGADVVALMGAVRCSRAHCKGSPSGAFQAEEKQMFQGWREVRFIPFSSALRPPAVPPAQTGVGPKVKEETIAQDALQIKESGR